MVRGPPVNYVYKDAPPLLIIHGDKDHTIPVTQSRLFVKKLEEFGVQHEYWEVPGLDHTTCFKGKIPDEGKTRESIP